jgi:hypothetical protein
MVTTVSRPGIGSMTQEPGPEGSSVWTLARPGYSALYGELVAVVLEDADDLDGVDWDLVAEVRDNPDRYLDAALRFVRGEVLADPAAFGLTVADLDPYRGEFDVERLPLDLPRMTFYADHEWVLHFQSGRLPVCDPYGLIVLFDRRRPARPEGIDGPI